MMRETAALLLVSALLAAPLTALVGSRRPDWASATGIVTAAIAFAVALWGWAAGGSQFNLDWAPSWGLRLHFALDGLATLYALLATGIGLAVLIYAHRYVRLHLEHQERALAQQTRFSGLILLFMGAMVGLVLAQDLLLIFLFWDLTAIASYFLIGFDRQEASARAAAFMALLVTGISAIGLLVAVVLLQAVYQTFSLPEIAARIEPGSREISAATLIVIAGLAKSAQVPLHFWLPRAMAAPTPVSAYLHSAAMVAAGVFLLARFYPVLALSPRLLDLLIAVGFVSMAVGGALALVKDELKQLLAYSTIAQYGYVVVMLGIGGAEGIGGAAFYVIAHALAKSALFLTAGAVTEATGVNNVSGVGGLWRSLPLLAMGSGAAAATLAALPLTIGFFKDELFFAAALHHSRTVTVLAVVGAAMTFAYVCRFWIGVFLGPLRTQVQPVSPWLTWPVLALGLLAVISGVVVAPAARLASAAATIPSLGLSAALEPAYHLDRRPENLMAIAAYLLGAGLYASRRWWQRGVTGIARLGDRVGPERVYQTSLFRLNTLSDTMHRIEVHDLRGRIASILLPGGVLVVAGVLVTPFEESFVFGPVQSTDVPLVLILTLAAGAALAATIPRDHLTLSVVLSGLGFSLAVGYALLGGPNVALVAVLIETLFALLFLGVLVAIPRGQLRRASERRATGSRRWRDPLVALIAGGVTFVVVWGVLSKPAATDSASSAQMTLTPTAHAKDVVTAILADFRGLDTMGEITVIGIALLGTATLLRGGRLR